ncbi:transcription factor bHLH112 isoform X1 [Ziziphus jujuba]|uniref:Transcription factor bHLH112 isoform X1 n=1 Tax=Ziziphus jujuba TaxID=326968 RepID=A0A6P4AEN2_ZIZJJ|nr:transcription factor bHLH112 isoform X1 [Ziziphus jujuba]
MAEEFQAGICGGNWWNSSRTAFTASPCSVGLNDLGSFGWPCDMVDIKARSSSSYGETNGSVVCDTSIAFQDVQKPQTTESITDTNNSTTTDSILIDSTLQMMGFGLSTSSTTSDLSQALLSRSSSGRIENSYHSMLQQDMGNKLNYRRESDEDSSQIHKDWSPENFSGGGGVGDDSSMMNGFKPNQDFTLDQSSAGTGSVTTQGLSSGFPVVPASYGYAASTLLQGFFDGESQPQQSFNNRSMNYSSASNYGTNNNNSSNIVSPSWPRLVSPFLRSSQPKQHTVSGLNFTNNTPFWNASAAGLNDIRASLFPTSSQSTYLAAPTIEDKPNCRNLTTKVNSNEDVQDSGSVAVKKSGNEPVFKRPRIETPSPLPTFKVRKEKLGDRITALQQLVSPFGKTDTASVLHEAIEYIKFLHDQVSVLSTPYMKNGAPIHPLQSSEIKDSEGPKQDLKSRGLCLVPMSSTFPVANETTPEFWTPTFGGTYR